MTGTNFPLPRPSVQFSQLAKTEEKCLHRQRRRGLLTLFCVRPVNHLYVEGLNHLHDVVYFGEELMHDPETETGSVSRCKCGHGARSGCHGYV